MCLASLVLCFDLLSHGTRDWQELVEYVTDDGPSEKVRDTDDGGRKRSRVSAAAICQHSC